MFGFKTSIKRKIQHVAAWRTKVNLRPKISVGSISLELDEKLMISEMLKCNQVDTMQPCIEKSEPIAVLNIDASQQSNDKFLILHED